MCPSTGIITNANSNANTITNADAHAHANTTHVLILGVHTTHNHPTALLDCMGCSARAGRRDVACILRYIHSHTVNKHQGPEKKKKRKRKKNASCCGLARLVDEE